MPQVNTVAGPVDARELGVTAIHERLLWGLPGWEHHAGVVFERSEAFEKLKGDLLEFKRLGGDTVVDCTGMASGRHVEFAQALSRATGVRIVCCTGLGAEQEIPGYFWPDRFRTIEQVTGVYAGEVERGMSVPYMRRTAARAGLIKAANGPGRVSEVEELLLRAAGRAGKRTGVAVTTYGASMGRRQLELLGEEGVPADRVIVGGADEESDPQRDRELAGRGAYVAYDSAAAEGRDLGRWAEAVRAMVQAGLADHVLVSAGTVGYALGQPQPPRGVAWLLSDVAPALRRAGVGESTLQTILVENPRRILGVASP